MLKNKAVNSIEVHCLVMLPIIKKKIKSKYHFSLLHTLKFECKVER